MQSVGHHRLPVQSEPRHNAVVSAGETSVASGTGVQSTAILPPPQSAPVESECRQQWQNLANIK